jgi:hypothetical protein
MIDYHLMLYPVAIYEDRYGGCYSKGKWLAVAEADIHNLLNMQGGPYGNDTDCADFWGNPPQWIAVGATPEEALNKAIDAAHEAGIERTAQALVTLRRQTEEKH